MENDQIIEAVWQLLFRRLKKSDRSTAEELRRWLAQQQANDVAKAVVNDPSSGWTASEMRRLQQQLVNDFRPAKRAVIMHLCLNALVQCWNKVTQIEAPPAPPMIRRPRAQNPWRHDVGKGLLFQATAKLDLEQAIIASSKQTQFDALALGLASGIIHLGLLHPDCILAVLRSLADPHPNLCWLGKALVIRHSLAVRGVPDSEHRIYIPDSLTAILLLQVTAKEAGAVLNAAGSGTDAPQKILRAISGRIQAALAFGQKKRMHCYSLDALLKCCTAAALYWRSPVTVAYLRRGLISHSPTMEKLARIEPTCKLLFVPQEQASAARTRTHASRQRQSSPPDDDAPEGDPADSTSKTPVPRSFSPLRAALTGADKQKARRRLDRLAKDDAQPSALRYLIEFATWDLSRKNPKRRNLRTLRDGVSLLSRFLLPRFEDDEDPAEIAKTGIEDLYLESIDIHQDSPSGASLSSQRKFARWLVRFHTFLVEEFKAKPLEELRAMEAGCLPVDANLIFEDEFLRVKEAIRTTRPTRPIPKEQRESAEVLLLLSVRTGLRHNESYWLRPCDFDFSDVCMLVVQPYGLRKLKTRNALRRLNLSALLLPGELELVQNFVASHQQAPLAPMFPPTPGMGLLDEDDLFAAIHSILRDTLGDQRLRYHHGRHSMGSLLALYLLSESTEYFGSLFPSSPAALARLEQCRKIREDLYGIGRNNVQISALDGLSDQIGHGNAKFTLAHYVHTLGFLAAAELANKPEFAYDRITLITAWYKHTSSIHRYAGNGLECIVKHRFVERFKAQLKKISQQRQQRSKTARRVPRLTDFQKALAALPLAAESSSEEEFRKAVEDPAIADAVTSALQESEKKEGRKLILQASTGIVKEHNA
jgi:hypothetical protein